MRFLVLDVLQEVAKNSLGDNLHCYLLQQVEKKCPKHFFAFSSIIRCPSYLSSYRYEQFDIMLFAVPSSI